MRFSSIVLIFAALLMLSCSKNQEKILPAKADTIEVRNDLGELFKEWNFEGSFLVYDMKTKKYSVYNDSLARCEFLPASTFKLPNSLIALECGAVADENETIKWDGVHRYYDFWDRDYNLKDALANSTVWFYQEMARRIGAERMQHWLDKINYGNKNIGGGIDQFWLRGDLRITSYGQIDFLRRLYEDSLPFSKHSMEIVKRIMLKDSTESYRLRAKTGWANVGWYVGWLETSDNAYMFANLIKFDSTRTEDFLKARLEITEKALKKLKLM